MKLLAASLALAVSSFAGPRVREAPVASPVVSPSDLSVGFQAYPRRILDDLAENVHPPIHRESWRIGSETQTALLVDDTIRRRAIEFDSTTNTEASSGARLARLRSVYGKESSVRVDTTIRFERFSRALERRWTWKTPRGTVEFHTVSEWLDPRPIGRWTDRFARELKATDPRIHPKAVSERKAKFLAKLRKPDGWPPRHTLTFSDAMAPAVLVRAMEKCLALRGCEEGARIRAADGSDSAWSLPAGDLSVDWLPAGTESVQRRETAGDSGSRFPVVVDVSGGIFDSAVVFGVETRRLDAAGTASIAKIVADFDSNLVARFTRSYEDAGGDPYGPEGRAVLGLFAENAREYLKVGCMDQVKPRTFVVSLRPGAWRRKLTDLLEPRDLTRRYLPSKEDAYFVPPVEWAPIHQEKTGSIFPDEELLFVDGKLEQRTLRRVYAWKEGELDRTLRSELDSLRRVFGGEPSFESIVGGFSWEDCIQWDQWRWRLPEGDVSVLKMSRFQDTAEGRRIAGKVASAVVARFGLGPQRRSAIEDSIRASFPRPRHGVDGYMVRLSNRLDPGRILAAMRRCLDLQACDALADRSARRIGRDSIALDAMVIPPLWFPTADSVDTIATGLDDTAVRIRIPLPAVVHHGTVDSHTGYRWVDHHLEPGQTARLDSSLDTLLRRPDAAREILAGKPHGVVDSLVVAAGLETLASRIARSYRFLEKNRSLVVFRRPEPALVRVRP